MVEASCLDTKLVILQKSNHTLGDSHPHSSVTGKVFNIWFGRQTVERGTIAMVAPEMISTYNYSEVIIGRDEFIAQMYLNWHWNFHSPVWLQSTWPCCMSGTVLSHAGIQGSSNLDHLAAHPDLEYNHHVIFMSIISISPVPYTLCPVSWRHLALTTPYPTFTCSRGDTALYAAVLHWGRDEAAC